MNKPVYLLIGVPALAVTLALSPLVHAESGSGSTTTTTNTQNAQPTSHESTGTKTSPTESKNADTGEVAAHRAALELKLKAMKAESKVRLDEKRKKVCETRSDKINALLHNRSEQATKQLAVFSKISDRVQAFVTSKHLTVANYDTLVAAINDKHAAAQAAIDVNTGTKFDCTAVSSDSPVKLPRETVKGVRDALKEYRTAIKNLIVNVKASASKIETTTTPTTSGEVSQ